MGFAAPPPPGCDSRKSVISPILYRIVVPLIRRNGQPMFSRRSFCRTFTLHPRMAAYTCSSTHAHPFSALGLEGLDGVSGLFHRAGHKPAHGVLLPAHGLHDLG